MDGRWPTRFCCDEELAFIGYDGRDAAKDLAALRSKGPRDVWWMVAFMRLYNTAHAMRRRPSRYFIYRHPDLRNILAEHGYDEIHNGGTAAWRVAIYRRV